MPSKRLLIGWIDQVTLEISREIGTGDELKRWKIINGRVFRPG